MYMLALGLSRGVSASVYSRHDSKENDRTRGGKECWIIEICYSSLGVVYNELTMSYLVKEKKFDTDLKDSLVILEKK